MHIQHIKISNILGIRELEFKAGQFVEVTGRNGQGKTSLLEAIKAATQGGHDATLLRKGAEKGEVVLVLDSGMEISKRVTERGSPTTVVGSDGAKAKKPAEVLKSLTDMLSVNPVDFLRAPKRDRVRVLLETMPLKIDTDKLTEISGVRVEAQPDVHALAVIDHVRKQVYDERTGTNRAVSEKEATINQLQLAMPSAPAGVEGSEDELNAKLKIANDTYHAETERIRAKMDGIQAAHNAAVQKIRDDAQAAIDKIKEEATQAAEAERAKLEDIKAKADRQRQITVERYHTQTSPLNQALAVITANREQAGKRVQALATIEQMEGELADLREDAEKQSRAIAAIDAYKLDLLANMPIPGLEIVDGDLYRDGVHFDRLNTAQQVQIAVELARLRAGPLGIVCVDCLELLDSETFAAFREQSIASGLQLFVSRVTDEDFSVQTTSD